MNSVFRLHNTSKIGFSKTFQFVRNFTVSSALNGKRNFRKFTYPNRGTPLDKKYFREHPELVDQRGMRLTGYWTGEGVKKKFVEVPEMIPELVVPDLTNFHVTRACYELLCCLILLKSLVINIQDTPLHPYEEAISGEKFFTTRSVSPSLLKPYVSYRTADIVQEKFTPEHLFYAVYSKKIKKDLEEGKLDENGNPLEPSKEESMGPEEAWTKARLTGSDLFG